MMIAAMCRKSGAAQIIISDLSDYRLDLAKKVGADITTVSYTHLINTFNKQRRLCSPPESLSSGVY